MEKLYFKGGDEIESLLDFNGDIIKEGDFLTHNWFDIDYCKFFRSQLTHLKLTDDEIETRVHEPSVVVKWNDKGYFYGEGFDEDERSRLYMHNFCFKYTKIIKNK